MSLDHVRVMLVEDEQNARATMRAMLAEMGIHQVFEANDGDSARQLMDMDSSMVDIVISDWNMPNFTGMELLKHMRSKNMNTPVLIVTGRNDIASVKEAKENEVSGYIRKPFSMKELEAKIKVIWEREQKNANDA
ncbi:MAG: response regulator [Pseudomonadota bacterium]